MDPVTIAGLAGAGASLFGGLVNNAWADARSDKQWNRTLYMQDKMNAYNAPVAQMERLAQAGLNPNLVYGNGGSVIQSAGGNAPNPPNTAPIDTQGVLQMVQTVVSGMLEKDRIQAQKEVTQMQNESNESIATERNKTQKEVTQMQNTTSERNVDVQTQSNENIANARNALEKSIADANRSENARQFNETLKQRIVEYNMSYGLQKMLAESQAYKNYSEAKLSQLRTSIEKDQFDLTYGILQIQSKSNLDAYRRDSINGFLARPYKFSADDVTKFFHGELGIYITPDQAEKVASSHNNLIGAISVSNRLDNSWTFGFLDKILGPVKAVLGAVK